MKNLTFPDYRLPIQVSTPDGYFGDIDQEVFDKMQSDVNQAYKENRDTYFDCLIKIHNTAKYEEIPF